MKAQSKLYPGWWKSPIIDFGLHCPAPYIWFLYWLITWDDYSDPWGGFKLKNLRISFMPD